MTHYVTNAFTLLVGQQEKQLTCKMSASIIPILFWQTRLNQE